MDNDFKYEIVGMSKKKKGNQLHLKIKIKYRVKLKYNQSLFEKEDSEYQVIFRMYVFERKDYNNGKGFIIKYLENDYANVEFSLMTKMNQKSYNEGKISKLVYHYELENDFLSIKAKIIPFNIKRMMGKININSIGGVNFPGTKKKAPYVGRKGQYISIYQGGGCGGK